MCVASPVHRRCCSSHSIRHSAFRSPPFRQQQVPALCIVLQPSVVCEGDRPSHTRSQYTTCAANSSTATTLPFSPVLRSVAHIKPIDKSQSSSFLPSHSSQVPSTHRYDLSSDTPHPHLRVCMIVLPKRASKFAPPRTPCVAYSSPSSPRRSSFISLCGARLPWGGERTRGARAGGGGHLFLVVVLEHMMSRAYAPPLPALFPVVLIHSPVPPCSSPYSSLTPRCTRTHTRTQDDEFAAGRRGSGRTGGSAGGEGRGGGNDTRPMRVPFLCA
jgi:hypothetical protein